MSDKKQWYEVECNSEEEGKFFSSIKSELKKYSDREYLYNACLKGHKSKTMRVLRSLMIPDVKYSLSFEEYQSCIRLLVEHGSKDVVRAIMDDTKPEILTHNGKKVKVQLSKLNNDYLPTEDGEILPITDPDNTEAKIETDQPPVSKPDPDDDVVEMVKKILKNQCELKDLMDDLIQKNNKSDQITIGGGINPMLAYHLLSNKGDAGSIDHMLMMLMNHKGVDIKHMLPLLMMQNGKPCVQKSKTLIIECMLNDDSIKNVDKFVAIFDQDIVDTCVSDLEKFIKAYKDFKASKNPKKSMFSGIIKIQNWFNSKFYK